MLTRVCWTFKYLLGPGEVEPKFGQGPNPQHGLVDLSYIFFFCVFFCVFFLFFVFYFVCFFLCVLMSVCDEE